MKPGDWVEVLPTYDIPVLFRPDGKPTTGRIHRIDDGVAEIWIPLSGADVDEHSQAASYPLHALALATR